MFIKIVPITDQIPSSTIYEGEDVRCELFVVTRLHDGLHGMGKYSNLLRESVESEFFKSNHKKWSVYETILVWFKSKSGENRVLEAPASSVFIMNDDGKTVDRLSASYSVDGKEFTNLADTLSN